MTDFRIFSNFISWCVVFALTLLFNKFKLMFFDFVYDYIHRKHFFESNNRMFDSIARCNRLTKHFFNIDHERNKLNNQQRRHFFTFQTSSSWFRNKRKKQKTTVLKFLKTTRNLKKKNFFVDIHVQFVTIKQLITRKLENFLTKNS